MTDETPAARKTRLARERKQAERKRNKDKRQAMGASKLKMEVFSGTARALEEIRQAGDFDERDHALTIVIHRVAELYRSNPEAFHKLINGKSK